MNSNIFSQWFENIFISVIKCQLKNGHKKTFLLMDKARSYSTNTCEIRNEKINLQM